MATTRGRRRVLDYEAITEEVMKHSVSVMTKEGKITPGAQEIWGKIVDELAKTKNIQMKSTDLYTFVVNNRADLRDKLREALGVRNSKKRRISSPASSASLRVDSDWEDSVVDRQLTHYSFSIPRKEFLDLIIKEKTERIRNGIISLEDQAKFKPYYWHRVILEKFWNVSRRQCGYNNIDSYVSVTTNNGTFESKCHCGSELKCKFKKVDKEMIFSCSVTSGDGRCGKIFLRNEHRLEMGERVDNENVEMIQAKMADKYLLDDDPACPLIPRATVLRGAKATYNKSKYWNKDPIVALSIMAATVYSEDIQFISVLPFTIHYWTNIQRQAYNTYASSGNPCAFIDATGSIYPKFTKFNDVKTHSSFLYVVVVNFNGEQFSVGQMVSEAHDTVIITNFWNKWLQYGFIKPREMVMDSGKALLTGTIIALTGYPTIESYADALATNAEIDCYIRLDIAHFMAMYARALKSLPTLIKRFYLGCVGKLVFITNLEEMREFLEKLFTVGLFTRAGVIAGTNQPCLAQKHINYLRDVITDSLVNSTVEETEAQMKTDDTLSSSDEETFGQGINDYTLGEEFSNGEEATNSWSTWGRKIFDDVEKRMENTKDGRAKGNQRTGPMNEDVGVDPNPYYYPPLIHRLLRDIKTIPLWSAVTHEKFNYGRIPASSASVECEIKKIKNNVYKKSEKVRVDSAIERHIQFLQGRMKIVNTAVQEKKRNLENSDTAADSNISQDAGEDRFSPFPATNNDDENDVSREKTRRHHDEFETDKTARDTGKNAEKGGKDVLKKNCRNKLNVPNKKRDKVFTRSPLQEKFEQSKFFEGANSIDDTGLKDTDDETTRGLSPTPLANSTFVLDESDPTENDCADEVSPECVACARGDKPGGGHWCKICKKTVHPFEKCSYPIEGEEEGYNKPRLCFSCHSGPKAHASELLAKRHVENWKNQGEKKENKPPRALYVGNNTDRLREMLIYEKSAGLPIMRAGQSGDLQPVRIAGRRITLRNTCPFDSIFQILLAGACDYDPVRFQMEKAPHNDLYKLVIESLRRPLSGYSYQQRVQILLPYFPVEHTIAGIEIIPCQQDVGGFARKIFRFMPSWIEKAQCNKGCPERVSFFPIINLSASALDEDKVKFNNVFDRWIFPQGNRRCVSQTCTGEEEITENIVDDIVAFEPYWENGAYVSKKLRDIHKEFKHPTDQSKMKLIGIVHFIPPARRSSINIKPVGHYFAICLRRDGRWIKYDGTETSSPPLRRTFEARIALMIYGKT